MKKTALISGASGEIGSAIAEKLAELDYDMVLLGNRNVEKTEQLAEKLRSRSAHEMMCFNGDLSDSSFTERIFNELFNRKDRSLNLLINCAGISHVGLLQDMTDEEWQRVIGTNLSSVFYLCRAAIPVMLRTGSGRIINISSVWGNVGASMEVAYSASKGGMNAFTKALAKELAPSGIPVNAIACGYIDTAMNAHLSEEEKTDLFAEIPKGRPGTVQEVAETVALLSTAPAYMTGQILTLDGGWT